MHTATRSPVRTPSELRPAGEAAREGADVGRRVRVALEHQRAGVAEPLLGGLGECSERRPVRGGEHDRQAIARRTATRQLIATTVAVSSRPTRVR